MYIQRIRLYRGEDKNFLMTLQSGDGKRFSADKCLVKMQARSPIDGTLLLELSTANGQIQALGSVLLITINAEDTARAVWKNANFDVLIETPQGRRMYVLRGVITLDANITMD